MMPILRKLLFLMLLGSGAAQAVPKVFQHCNYGGYGVELPPGKYNLIALASRGIRNNDLSSLKVGEGYIVTLYEHNDFKGKSLVKTTNDNCLVSQGFNDQVTSIIVKRRSDTADQTIEQNCQNYVQGRVHKHRDRTAASTKWSPSKLKRMCKGVSSIRNRISCFEDAIRRHDQVSFAIDLCNGTIPHSLAHDCYKQVQGKVAKDRAGKNKKWRARDLKRLCKDVTDIGTLTYLFIMYLDRHDEWSRAIDQATGTPLPETSLEGYCYDHTQNYVAWNRSGNKTWEPKTLRRLCKNTEDIYGRGNCFKHGLAHHGNTDLAIDQCNGTSPHKKTKEQQCLKRVQGKVAWHRQGHTRWRVEHLNALCKGVTNVDQRIQCFQNQIRSGINRDDAIEHCIRSERPLVSVKVKLPPLRLATSESTWGAFRLEHSSGFKFDWSKIPKSADCGTHATFHDGNNFALFCPKRGSSDTLYQFVYNPRTQKFEHRLSGFAPQVPIKGIPRDASPKLFAMLHDGRNHRLYMMNSQRNSLHQFVYKRQNRKGRFEYERRVKIIGTPKDALPTRFAMLHDGTNYRLYMRSRTREGMLYVFGYNPSERTYKYSGRSVKIRGMTVRDFSMLHNGDEYFIFAL